MIKGLVMRDFSQQSNFTLAWKNARAVQLFFAVIIAFALCHQSALAESLRSRDIKVFQPLYDTIDDATRRADTKKLASLMADSYVEYDTDNKMRRKPEVLEVFNAFFGQQKRSFKTTLKSAQISDGVGHVVRLRMDRGGLFWESEDTWQLSDGVWRLSESKGIGFGLAVSGKLEYWNQR